MVRGLGIYYEVKKQIAKVFDNRVLDKATKQEAQSLYEMKINAILNENHCLKGSA